MFAETGVESRRYYTQAEIVVSHITYIKPRIPIAKIHKTYTE